MENILEDGSMVLKDMIVNKTEVSIGYCSCLGSCGWVNLLEAVWRLCRRVFLSCPSSYILVVL